MSLSEHVEFGFYLRSELPYYFHVFARLFSGLWHPSLSLRVFLHIRLFIRGLLNRPNVFNLLLLSSVIVVEVTEIFPEKRIQVDSKTVAGFHPHILHAPSASAEGNVASLANGLLDLFPLQLLVLLGQANLSAKVLFRENLIGSLGLHLDLIRFSSLHYRFLARQSLFISFTHLH